MKKKLEPTPQKPHQQKLTDAERHKRFVDMAHEVEADEDPESFDRAFEKVLSATPTASHSHPSEKKPSS
jgi:hypothetical protein